MNVTLQSIAALKRASEYLEQWVDVIWDRTARDRTCSSNESQTPQQRAAAKGRGGKCLITALTS